MRRLSRALDLSAIGSHPRLSQNAMSQQQGIYLCWLRSVEFCWETLEGFMAERQGFEPWIPCGIHAFQACAFSHSAISPCNATI